MVPTGSGVPAGAVVPVAGSRFRRVPWLRCPPWLRCLDPRPSPCSARVNTQMSAKPRRVARNARFDRAEQDSDRAEQEGALPQGGAGPGRWRGCRNQPPGARARGRNQGRRPEAGTKPRGAETHVENPSARNQPPRAQLLVTATGLRAGRCPRRAAWRRKPQGRRCPGSADAQGPGAR